MGFRFTLTNFFRLGVLGEVGQGGSLVGDQTAGEVVKEKWVNVSGAFGIPGMPSPLELIFDFRRVHRSRYSGNVRSRRSVTP